MSVPMLELDRLSIRLRTQGGGRLLRSVSLTLQAGEIHGLVGESGAGKSMIGRAIFGILPPVVAIAEGAVRLAGVDLFSLGDRQRRLTVGRSAALIK
jgi:peptide/nickel transport system ATP-binding protein